MKHFWLLAMGLVPISSFAQFPDQAMLTRWEEATVIHYEVVGVISDRHVQIPPTDADLYADVVDRVMLSFSWDRNSGTFIGSPRFTNASAEISNLQGMTENCPAGEINGAYEHFDIVSMLADGSGVIVLSGQRIHPETAVAESCGTGRRIYTGAVEPVTEYIAPPDPTLFAFRDMMSEGPVTVSADGRSIIMTALNNNWVWTFTPTSE